MLLSLGAGRGSECSSGATRLLGALRFPDCQRRGYCLLLPEKASPRNTAANTKNTTPMPEESLVKSTIAITRNAMPARALPSACLDMSRLYQRRSRFLSQAAANRPPGFREINVAKRDDKAKRPHEQEVPLDALGGGPNDRGSDRATVLIRDNSPQARTPEHEVAARHRFSCPRTESRAEGPCAA
jgi:hypothetical protein